MRIDADRLFNKKKERTEKLDQKGITMMFIVERIKDEQNEKIRE